jgi:hypothetical protein
MGGNLPQPKFLLRWRLEYSGKPSRYGMWGDSAPGVEAWNQSRANLVRAQIEAKDIVTRETSIVVDCPAADYRVFQWVGVQRLNIKSSASLQRNVGLAILTNDQRIEAFEWGEVRQRPLINGEKNIKFATDGR